MSGPTINLNLTANREPTLKDLLDLHAQQINLDMNCHHLATIQSFDATTQTATVTLNYTKTLFKIDESTGEYVSYLQSYPAIADCPVIVLGGGPVRITFPITAGDQCLLLFNDRDIDNWFAGSLNSPVATPSLHAFTDAIALIGPNNVGNFVASYDAVRALITNGTVMVGINPTNNKVALTNGTSLGTLLSNLCTQLNDLTTALAALTVTGVTTGPGISGVPANAAAITSIGTQISSISTQLGLLLE